MGNFEWLSIAVAIITFVTALLLTWQVYNSFLFERKMSNKVALATKQASYDAIAVSLCAVALESFRNSDLSTCVKLLFESLDYFSRGGKTNEFEKEKQKTAGLLYDLALSENEEIFATEDQVLKYRRLVCEVYKEKEAYKEMIIFVDKIALLEAQLEQKNTAHQGAAAECADAG